MGEGQGEDMAKFVSPTLTIAVIALVVGIIVLTQLAIQASVPASEGKYSYCEYLFNTDGWEVLRCR